MRRVYAITGVANDWSLAWAVALRLIQHGHECHVCCLPRNARKVTRLLRDAGQPEHVYPADAREPGAVGRAMQHILERVGGIDGALHAIAFADVEELANGVLGSSAAGFHQAMQVSVYSLIEMCQALQQGFRPNGSVVTLSYLGSQRCVPGYGVMGVAKAALESAVRYLASELGPVGVRVNTVSSGAVLTPAASAFSDIEARIQRSAEIAPLRRSTSPEDVAATVDYLFSEAASGITAQCMYVDCGVSTLALV